MRRHSSTAKYYEKKVNNLKKVKKLSGMTSAYSSGEQIFRSPEKVYELLNLTTSDLANTINEAFFSQMSNFLSLSQNVLSQFDASLLNLCLLLRLTWLS